MKGQAFNPYLPAHEYIPDGEPYVFGDRVYVYGSHDKFNGKIFCLGDYVCYSASVDDLSDWRYEGVIFRKDQDPKNRLGLRLLFAPDVVQGRDGKFYLYYAFDFMGIMGVAICDTPAGEYQFLGYVHYKDGCIWGRKKGDQFPFDPGIFIDDDGRIFLYSGFYTPVPAIMTGGKKLRFDGGTVVELESDMLTIKSDPKVIFPKAGEGSFHGHEFFEASSMRKIKDTYYFVYSSANNHELCYATSKYPDKEFQYGGTLVDIGDLYLDNNMDENHAKNYLGNTHGGLVCIKDQWYIFYHRHTNRHSYSRQACAEKLVLDEKGHFHQAEITSCGLNPGPLVGEGTYEARIACNLWAKEGTGRYDCKHPEKVFKNHPYFTQIEKDNEDNATQYIANMQDGAAAGFKYFDIQDVNQISVVIRGEGEGKLLVSEDPEGKQLLATVSVSVHSGSWNTSEAEFAAAPGVKALYFSYIGSGKIDFYQFSLTR